MIATVSIHLNFLFLNRFRLVNIKIIVLNNLPCLKITLEIVKNKKRTGFTSSGYYLKSIYNY